jgi:hypothetical protein
MIISSFLLIVPFFELFDTAHGGTVIPESCAAYRIAILVKEATPGST